MITPQQSKAARALLEKDAQEVAKDIGVASNTMSRFEKNGIGGDKLKAKLTHYYLDNGITLTKNGGVDKVVAVTHTYLGADGFRKFMDKVYETAKSTGGEILLYNARPDNWIKWLGKEWNAMHTTRMGEIVDRIKFKAIAQEGDTNFVGSKHAEYRWISKDHFNDQSIYVFADYIAFLNFSDTDISIFSVKNQGIAESMHFLINHIWVSETTTPDDPQHKPS